QLRHRGRRFGGAGMGTGARHGLGPPVLAPGLALPDATPQLAPAGQPGAATVADAGRGAHDRTLLVLVQGLLRCPAGAEFRRVLDHAGHLRRAGYRTCGAQRGRLLRRPGIRERPAPLAEPAPDDRLAGGPRTPPAP